MTRSPVKSSNLKAIGYDPKTKTLEVEFHTGAVHQYSGVPPKVHTGLINAKSIGGYFQVNVRNFYKGKQVG